MIYRCIQNAIDYAETNLATEVEFRRAASEAFMSVATFYRTFEVFVGMTFMEYVRRRLAVALEALRTGASVTRVASDSCYEDINSFSRAFKKEFGLSPSTYAKKGGTISGLHAVSLMSAFVTVYEREVATIQRRNVMANAQERMVIQNVKRVGFLQNRGDTPYAPESFAFPACFASAMRSISGESHEKETRAHEREWIYDLDYHEAMAASGMAFGNLWPTNRMVCMSVNDFTQIASRGEIFSRAFRWFGYEMSYYVKKGTESEGNFLKELVVASISSGKPVIATNLVSNPEFGLITGYGQKGDVVIGWSHFQDQPGACDGFEETGECRVGNWYEKVWELVLFGNKTTAHKDPYALLVWALDILEGQQPCGKGFHGGLNAYDAWIEFLTDKRVFDADEPALKQILAVHSTYTGTLAEARAWAHSFFTSVFMTMLPRHADEIERAASCCISVHDLMWEVWGALGSGPGDMSVWDRLRDSTVRKQTASIIEKAKHHDTSLIEVIKSILSDRFAGDSERLTVPRQENFPRLAT